MEVGNYRLLKSIGIKLFINDFEIIINKTSYEAKQYLGERYNYTSKSIDTRVSRFNNYYCRKS